MPSNLSEFVFGRSMTFTLTIIHGLRKSASFGWIVLLLTLIGCIQEPIEKREPFTLSSVSPAIGSTLGGTRVTLSGKGLSFLSAVKINGNSCTDLLIVDDTSAICTALAQPVGTYSLVAVNSIGEIQTTSFSYGESPGITSITPSRGPSAGGTSVTITGVNFEAGTTVKVGSNPCTSVVVVDASTITCVTAAETEGLADVAVTSPEGFVTTASDLYEFLPPPILYISTPSGGNPSGGTSVLVRGDHFLTGATITFNGTLCSSATVVNETTISCTTPAGSAGVAAVVVTNPDGQTVTSSVIYTYQNAPTVTSVSPASGFTIGGNTVTITGTGFLSGATVDFGTSSCSNVTVASPTSITCTTPSGTGAVNVTVTNPDTQTGSATSAFTYVGPPTVTGISPNNGDIAGGTAITITGTNFDSGATISLGSVACTSPVFVNATTLTCTTGARAAGSVDVTVTNSDTQSATLASGFIYQSSPTVTAVSPNGGPLSGGTLVTLTGTNFLTGATVILGGNPCTGETVVTSTQMTCTTAPNIAGAVNVTVTNSGGQNGTGSSLFTYRNPPTVTSVTPSSGFASGGTAVTVTGTGFISGASVSFGGSLCADVVVIDANNITCTTAAHTGGVVNVSVINTDTQTGSATGAYTYQPAPVVSSVSPIGGPIAGGTFITISGSNFVSGASVNVGGNPCTIGTVGPTVITCTTPAGTAGAASVEVTNPDTQTNALSGGFTYQAGPVVSSISPVAGALAGGTSVTITGSNFLSGASVDLGGSVCNTVTIIDSNTITCTTTAHAAGAVAVRVVNPDTQENSLAAAYTYQAAPTVTAVTPNIGNTSGGTNVTITGTNFLAGVTVSFDGSPCNPVTLVSSTSLSCITSAHPAGASNITVTNTDSQSGTGSGLFTYQPAPVVTSASPGFGPVTGGQAITITGENFVTGVTVTVGGNPCSAPSVTSSTTLTCLTPNNGATGAVNISVTNPDGQVGSASTSYIFVNPPTVTSVSPDFGPLAGGDLVTVNGTGFLPGASVTFDGFPCNSPNVINSTSISCIVPSNVAGSVSVTVSNSDSQSHTLASAYSYILAPTVSSISPSNGDIAGGTLVTVTGTNFMAGATVTIGSANCSGVVISGTTSLTCTTGANAAGPVTVLVTNTDSQAGSLSASFTYAPPPTVTSVVPNGGDPAGGTLVTITGTNFFPGATVDFGGSACSGVSFTSSTTLTCTTTAHAAGAVTVAVTNSGLQSGSLASGFSYQNAPTVASVSPTQGAGAGGTSVTITGTGFVSGATVVFGGVPCSVTGLTATSITCTTGSRSPGTVNMTVTNPDLQDGSLTSAYTYLAAPVISTISPNNGPLAGGTFITITGTDFLSGATIDVGGTPCAGTAFVDSMTMTCTTPSGTGASSVTLTNPDSQTATSTFTFNPLPTISSISPSGSPPAGGQTIIISGTGFISGATVSVGGSACTSVAVSSSTTISCITPAGSGTVGVTVTNPDGQAVTLPSALTYQNPPTVASISPVVGALAGGTSVTITGTDFLSGASVSIGGTPCTGVGLVSSTTLTCTTGARVAGTVNVSVVNPDAQVGTATSAFTYQGPPTVTSVTPNGGLPAGGTSISITGTNFSSGASVDLGGVACTSVTVVNPTTISCITAPRTAGAVTVTVTNADTQGGSLSSGFTYRDAPTVSSVSPAVGNAAGGTNVTITGTGFLAGASVDFSGSACSNIVVVNSTTITCTTTSHAAGAVTVTITNQDTLSGNAASAFTYLVAPTVTSVSPASGIPAGGTEVTITGTNFASGASIDFGGSACTGVVFNSPTSLTCTTTAHASGAVSVTVTNSDGQSASASAYTYQSQAVLKWQVGSASPTPPDPADYGSTTTNITYTFTLRNTGDQPTSSVNVFRSGTNSGAWAIGTDNCSSATLNPGDTCTVQLTFLGAFLSTGSYSAVLNATATSGGSTTNNLSGTVP